MTGPDPTERTPTQPSAAEAPPPTPPPRSSAAPPPTQPAAAAPPPTLPPAWQPPPADRGGGASLVLGVIVLVIGAWFFATRTLGLDLPDLDWGQLWPVILILLGGLIVYRSVRRAR